MQENNMHQKVALKLGLIFSHCAGSSLLMETFEACTFRFEAEYHFLVCSYFWYCT